jgi:hypothetical protein
MAKRRTARPDVEGAANEPSPTVTPAKSRKRTRTVSRSAAESASPSDASNALSVSDAFAIRAHASDRSAREGISELPTEEDIRVRAYYRYVERGRLDGRALEDWIFAEQELYGR